VISNTKNGRIAEYIAGASLEEQGFSTTFCQQDGMDILCFKDKNYYRVQVKGSLLRKKKGYLHHQFNLALGGNKRLPNIEDYDFCALVSLYARRCFYMPVESMKNYTLRKTLRFFDNRYIEEESLTKTLDIIHQRQERTEIKWRH